jgi:hypothetical protein
MNRPAFLTRPIRLSSRLAQLVCFGLRSDWSHAVERRGQACEVWAADQLCYVAMDRYDARPRLDRIEINPLNIA